MQVVCVWMFIVKCFQLCHMLEHLPDKMLRER